LDINNKNAALQHKYFFKENPMFQTFNDTVLNSYSQATRRMIEMVPHAQTRDVMQSFNTATVEFLRSSTDSITTYNQRLLDTVQGKK
jgi:hypothetical protein